MPSRRKLHVVLRCRQLLMRPFRPIERRLATPEVARRASPDAGPTESRVFRIDAREIGCDAESAIRAQKPRIAERAAGIDRSDERVHEGIVAEADLDVSEAESFGHAE